MSRNIPRGQNTTSSSCGDDTNDPLVEAGTCEGDPFVSSSFMPMEPTLQSSCLYAKRPAQQRGLKSGQCC